MLVVGAGGAGLSAAWSARRSGAGVLHVTKGSKASCNTAKAQGGIQAAMGDDDSPEQHAADIVASSHDTADPALAGVLADEAPGAIAWLEELGVTFSREGDGYRLARCGGASRRRLLQVGDRTGHAIATALRKALDADSGRIHDHTALVGLERTNGHFDVELEQGGERVHVEAGAVILAAGGRCYAEARRAGILTTNQPGATGEATELARGLGAEVRDFDATIPTAACGRRRSRATRSPRPPGPTARSS